MRDSVPLFLSEDNMTTKELVSNWLTVWVPYRDKWAVDAFIINLSHLVTGYSSGSDFYDENYDSYGEDGLSEAKQEFFIEQFLSKKNSHVLSELLALSRFDEVWTNFSNYLESNNQVAPTQDEFITELLDNQEFAEMAETVLTTSNG